MTMKKMMMCGMKSRTVRFIVLCVVLLGLASRSLAVHTQLKEHLKRASRIDTESEIGQRISEFIVHKLRSSFSDSYQTLELQQLDITSIMNMTSLVGPCNYFVKFQVTKDPSAHKRTFEAVVFTPRNGSPLDFDGLAIDEFPDTDA
eukprot:ANDGO_01730.mRNA.1 hypothetical protein